MAHLGKNLHRLSSNELEREFSEAWSKQNENRGGPLSYLLGEGNRPDPTTEHEEMVAATVIQWLGSPVGQGFLQDVLGTPAGRQFLKYIK